MGHKEINIIMPDQEDQVKVYTNHSGQWTLIIALILLTAFVIWTNWPEDKRIDINQVTVEDLILIDGIGYKKARDIIRYRDEHDVDTINELMRIEGIGPKTVKKLKQKLVINTR